MGFMTNGKPLAQGHPFFRPLDAANSERIEIARVGRTHNAEKTDTVDDDDLDDDDYNDAEQHIDESDGEDDKSGSSDEDYVDARQ